MTSNTTAPIHSTMLPVEHDYDSSLRVFDSSFNAYPPPPMSSPEYLLASSKSDQLGYAYYPALTAHNLLPSPLSSSVRDQMTLPLSYNQQVDTSDSLPCVHVPQSHSSSSSISATHHHHHIHQHLYPQSSSSTSPPIYHEPSTWLGSGEYQPLQCASNPPAYRHYPTPCSVYPPNHFYDPSPPTWLPSSALKFEQPYSPPPTYVEPSGNFHPSCHEPNAKEEPADLVSQATWPRYPSSPAQLTPTPPKNPLNGKTRTRDKYRIVYTDQQRNELESEFVSSKYISIPRKSALSLTLALSERQIKIWFQNRRAKERKMNKRRHDSSHAQRLNQSNNVDSPSDDGADSPTGYSDYI